MLGTVISLIFLFTFSFCRAQINPSPLSARQCSRTPLTTSSNNFGSALINSIGGDDNFFISPLSIYSALAMTYLGANGRTAQEMEEAFQLTASNLPKDQFHQSFKEALNLIKDSNSDEYKLLVANGIFMQENFETRQQFLEDIQTYYGGTARLVNFVTKGVEAKDQINAFVAENTQNQISTLLQEPLDPSTVMALLNAVYFKGTWQKQFPPEMSENGTFYKTDGSKTEVTYMSLNNEHFRVFEDYQVTKYQFLELPYKGNHISMLLALPMDRKATPELNMTSDLLCDIKSKLTSKKMFQVMIPKFKLKYRKELVNVLRALGINDLFGSSADLTGISENGNLQVSDVIHEAVIDVNEEGSEASAATGIFITRMSIPMNQFHANHPFLFYIIDNRNNLILFSGRMSDPRN